MCKSTIKITNFNSYVSLPEGMVPLHHNNVENITTGIRVSPRDPLKPKAGTLTLVR